jgi:hypothetical protein
LRIGPKFCIADSSVASVCLQVNAIPLPASVLTALATRGPEDECGAAAMHAAAKNPKVKGEPGTVESPAVTSPWKVVPDVSMRSSPLGGSVVHRRASAGARGIDACPCRGHYLAHGATTDAALDARLGAAVQAGQGQVQGANGERQAQEDVRAATLDDRAVVPGAALPLTTLARNVIFRAWQVPGTQAQKGGRPGLCVALCCASGDWREGSDGCTAGIIGEQGGGTGKEIN